MTATEWLSTAERPIAEGLALLRDIPAAATFLTYASCYSEETQRKEIEKYLGSLHQPLRRRGESTTPFPSGEGRGEAATHLPLLQERVGERPEGRGEASRPSNYAAWSDQQSPELREAASHLLDLYTQLAYWRQELEKTVEKPNHSEADISRYAKLAVAYDKKIQCIHARANAEWEQMQGRTVTKATLDAINKEAAAANREIESLSASPKPSPKGEGEEGCSEVPPLNKTKRGRPKKTK